MTPLAWWVFLTVVVLVGFLIWAFMPILIPLLLVSGVLAILVALIVGLTRWVAQAGGISPSSQPGGDAVTTPRSARRRSDLPD